MPNLPSHSFPASVAPAAALRSASTGSPPVSAGVLGAPGLSFTIGQDASGCWVAVERHGVAGGLFRNRADALHYADGEIRHGTGEIRFAAGPVAFTVGR